MPTECIGAPQYLKPVEDRDERTLRRIHAFVEALSVGYRQGKISPQKIKEVYREFGEEFLCNTLQGHGWRKPYGYAGDFLMIDKIYTRYISENPEYNVWDEYFQRQAAPQAVRNRKEYFKRLLGERVSANESLALLNVGSGPARDLAEVYAELSHPQRLHTTCVDTDQYAITYAEELNRPYLPHIKFVPKHVLRFRSEQHFHLIWSAGLFGYFNDKVFVVLLRRFRNCLKPGGEIVIGNFNQDHNPSRDYMEVFGDWHLHHRTKSQLISLALQAGFDEDHISVGFEPENVNLFLHIKSDEFSD